MFCNNCGREIVDGAKFCNYCGATITARPQTVQAAQPVQQEQPAQAPKEGGKGGKRLLTILLAVAVFFGVRYATENLIFGKKSSSGTTTSTGSSGVIELNKASPLSTCLYGGLYQDDYLTYGSARVHLPGYQLLPGEGSNPDMLISADETALVGINRTLEARVSFDASDANGILESYQGSSFTNVLMADFRKYEVDGYPVIRYIMSCTDEGVDEYIGELIILPGRTASETLRISMYTLAECGTAPINKVFDSLSISSAYNLKPGDVSDVGVQQITVK